MNDIAGKEIALDGVDPRELYVLAVLEGRHAGARPPEALFTATEETAWIWRLRPEGRPARGDILLNLDSETEGELSMWAAPAAWMPTSCSTTPRPPCPRVTVRRSASRSRASRAATRASRSARSAAMPTVCCSASCARGGQDARAAPGLGGRRRPAQRHPARGVGRGAGGPGGGRSRGG